MKTKYIASGDYYLTEYRTASGRLQLAEGHSFRASRRAMLTLQRNLGTSSLSAVRTQRTAPTALAAI